MPKQEEEEKKEGEVEVEEKKEGEVEVEEKKEEEVKQKEEEIDKEEEVEVKQEEEEIDKKEEVEVKQEEAKKEEEPPAPKSTETSRTAWFLSLYIATDSELPPNNQSAAAEMLLPVFPLLPPQL